MDFGLKKPCKKQNKPPAEHTKLYYFMDKQQSAEISTANIINHIFKVMLMELKCL